MTVAVSFAVQAHPTRSREAEALADALGGDVVYDPAPDAPPSAWRSFRRLLEETPDGATHRFQVQDDAELCPGLRQAVEAAAAARPDHLLVFHVGRNPGYHSDSVMDACRRDLPWAELRVGYWVPVVSTCWPAALAADLLAYSDEQGWDGGARWGADDERVGRWARDRNVRPLASVPSLVEHPDLLPSALRRDRGRDGPSRNRVAACYIGSDCGECAALIDWTLGPGG